MTPDSKSAKLVLVLPVLNEMAHLPGLIAYLDEEATASQRQGLTPPPVLLLDGGSTDGSRAYAAACARERDWLIPLHNPERHQGAAVNRAAILARDAGATVLLRMDAHAAYPAGYARRLAEVLTGTRADSVVVPLLSTGTDGWAAAAADLQNRWIGHGGAQHRSTGKRGWVRHGHHAAFRLKAFLTLGGYDTRFVANEDAEFDLRLTRAGGGIFLEDRWPVAYCPREGPRALGLQMWRNGIWRGRCFRKHRICPGPRQALPLAATATVAATPPVAAAFGPAALAPLLLYLATTLVLTAPRDWPPDPSHWVRCLWLSLISHMAFGAGLAVGLMTPLCNPQSAANLTEGGSGTRRADDPAQELRAGMAAGET